MKDRWLKAELHNHTIHSDGGSNPTQLVDYFAAQGTEVLALSDHNSVTGHEEFLKACQDRNVIPILANEITTFWGHILGLGFTEYLDWSLFSPEKPEEICEIIHNGQALCGLAHPFRLGYPVNTGCNWLMQLKDFSQIDYIEIMNTSDKGRCLNHVAVDFWLDLQRKGIKLTGVAGKDWHGRLGDASDFCTYINMPEESGSDVLYSIKKGSAYISSCGLVNAVAENCLGHTATIGEILEAKGGPVTINLSFATKHFKNPMVLVEVHDRNGLTHQSLHSFAENLRFDIASICGFAVIKIFAGNSTFSNLQYISNPIYIQTLSAQTNHVGE